MIFRTTIATPKHLVCSACGQSERIWSDHQIARWKVAHVADCAANQPTGSSPR